MKIRVLQFVAIVLTALALIPPGAHLLELANKINLDREHYLTVQQIYRGWALLGAVLIASALANGVLAVATRRQTAPMILAAITGLLMCVTLGVFFIWTYPVNQATDDWTVAPENWQMLRVQWEYSHAANAVVTFLALCSAVASGLSWLPRTRS